MGVVEIRANGEVGGESAMISGEGVLDEYGKRRNEVRVCVCVCVCI